MLSMFLENGKVYATFLGRATIRHYTWDYSDISNDTKKLLDSKKIIIDFDGLWTKDLQERFPFGIGAYIEGMTICISE